MLLMYVCILGPGAYHDHMKDGYRIVDSHQPAHHIAIKLNESSKIYI